MADIAASVLARPKSKAAESGRTYYLCPQLFSLGEFLRRLLLQKSMLVSEFPLWHESRTPEHCSELTSVLVMSLCQNRKNERSPRSLIIFLAKPFIAAVTDNDLTKGISSVNEWKKYSYGSIGLPSIDYDDDSNKMERFRGNRFSKEVHKFKAVGRPTSKG